MNEDVDYFNPTEFDSDIPLMSADQHREEHTANTVSNSILYTPKLRVNPNSPLGFTMSKLPRDEEAGTGQSFIENGHDRQENGTNTTLIQEFGFSSSSRGVSVTSPSR